MENYEKEMRIALGCGNRPIEGFIGLDSVDFGWNKLWDATKDPLPFFDDQADFIQAYNFLEHIERKYYRALFNECWRVLKPNGILEIIVPDVEKSIALAVADITHQSFWVKGTFKYLTGERPRNADYGFKRWVILQCRNYDEKEPRCIFAQIKPNK